MGDGTVEISKCDTCNTEKQVNRRYYHYKIKCNCCNGKNDNHFEIVRYCSSCEPKPPKRISVVLEPYDD